MYKVTMVKGLLKGSFVMVNGILELGIQDLGMGIEKKLKDGKRNTLNITFSKDREFNYTKFYFMTHVQSSIGKVVARNQVF